MSPGDYIIELNLLYVGGMELARLRFFRSCMRKC